LLLIETWRFPCVVISSSYDYLTRVTLSICRNALGKITRKDERHNPVEITSFAAGRLHPSADHLAMDDPVLQRLGELIRHLDPETREIVCDLVRRLVSLEEINKVIEKRRH
jgi:hypothetical protein